MTDALMEFSGLVTGVELLEAVSAEWQKLAERVGASPFAYPAWIAAWFSAFGNGSLQIFTARRDGELTGVLPLIRSGGLLLAPANAQTPLFESLGMTHADHQALLDAALRSSRRGVLLRAIEAGGPLSTAATGVGERGDCLHRKLDHRVSSRIGPLNRGEFEATLSKSRRRNNRRRLRGLEKEGELGWRSIEGPVGDAAFADFLRLEASPWKVSGGTAITQSSRLVRFYRETMDRAAAGGQLHLRFLTLDDRAIGVQLAMDDARRRWGMKIGFDPELSRYAPGVLQQLDEAITALDEGLIFELGFGEETLKREIRTDTWGLESVGVFPRSTAGMLAATVTSTRTRIYRRAARSPRLRTARDRVRALRGLSQSPVGE